MPQSSPHDARHKDGLQNTGLSSTSDIDTFVSLVNGQAIPYIKRLAVARDQLMLASLKEYEIVPADRYNELHRCIKSMEIISGEDFANN